MRDRPLPATPGPEPEITPEMIEAGAVRLLRFSRDGDLEDEAVREIYSAMWRLRPRAAPSLDP